MATQAMQNDQGIVGVPTCLTDLDEKLGGLHRSDLIILAGRPSMGKTALATNIAYNAAQNILKKIAKNFLFQLDQIKTFLFLLLYFQHSVLEHAH